MEAFRILLTVVVLLGTATFDQPISATDTVAIVALVIVFVVVGIVGN